jgi:hypothetical protein
LGCLTYLSFDSFDKTFSAANSSDINNQILSGDLVLLEYAAVEWLSHVREFSRLQRRQRDAVGKISDAISKFYSKRASTPVRKRYDNAKSRKNFRSFRGRPELVTQLAHLQSFKKMLASGHIDQDGM